MSDFVDDHERAKELDILTKKWKKEKEKEDKCRAARLELEEEILKISQIDPEIPGTKVYPNSVRASCKLNRKWDQVIIHKYYPIYCLNLPKAECPFTVVYKENKKNMDLLRLTHPTMYKAFQEGLTEEAARPSFKLNKPKEGIK